MASVGIEPYGADALSGNVAMLASMLRAGPVERSEFRTRVQPAARTAKPTRMARTALSSN